MKGLVEGFQVGVLIGLVAGVSFILAAMFGDRYTRRFVRWVLWSTACFRGGRCSKLTVVEIGPLEVNGQVIELDPDAIAGSHGVITWYCRRCGTHYQRSVLIGNDGAFTEGDPERIPA